MTTAAAPTRILVVDDHAVVRLGLAGLLATTNSLQVVGEAGTVAEAFERADRCRPDVVIMDVRLPDGSGVEACREIRSRRPSTRVLMLTSFSDPEAVIAAVMAGASGYLLKNAEPHRLNDGVTTVARGGSLLDPAVTQGVLETLRLRESHAEQKDPLDRLSEHERRLLPLIAAGNTNREIAGKLHLSEHTIKTYVSEIFRKLNLSRRAEAAAFIVRHTPQQDPAFQ